MSVDTLTSIVLETIKTKAVMKVQKSAGILVALKSFSKMGSL